MAAFPFKPELEQFPLVTAGATSASPATVPTIDLSSSDATRLIVKASEELGFFKVVNHGVPMELSAKLESEALKFFSLPLPEKVANQFRLRYGSRTIGGNGDVGWVEYLLMTTAEVDIDVGRSTESFRRSLKEYVTAVRATACEVVELMADGLRIRPRAALSRLLNDEQSDSLLRLNHYPPWPQFDTNQNQVAVGFGEHTDPHIISVLRANDVHGFQILLPDGRWVSVPPDETSFFVSVGDSLQVMTNGRFKSVRHRVVANGGKARLSMVYFGGPPKGHVIAPLRGLGQRSMYREFTWLEYITSAFKKPLAHNRLGFYEKVVAS